MPPKRPAPLSDAALSRGGQSAVLGETNAGVPLPVKNTFIDVPSGLTPTHSPSKRGNPMMTAPAQVNFAPGFVRRSVNSAALPPTPSSPDSPMKVTSALRGQGQSESAVVQRPGGVLGPGFAVGSALPSTPLATPSPSSNSLFSAARYQLFGGPTPVQEATYSALAPVGGAPVAAQGTLGLPPPLHSPQLPNIPSFLPYGNSSNSTLPASVHAATLSYPLVAPAAVGQAAVVATAGTAGRASEKQLASVPQESRSKGSQSGDEDDGDDDDSEDGHGQQQASGRTLEDAPKPPPGAKHPSLGSQNHEEGTCKRCCFFPRNRCLNGYECEFCHYEHEKRKRKNKKSKKRSKDGGSGAAQHAEPGAASASSTAPAAFAPPPPEASPEAAAAAGAAAWGVLPPEVAHGADLQMWESMMAAEQASSQLMQQAGLPPPLYDGLSGGAAPLVTYFWTDGIPGQAPAFPPPHSFPAAPSLSYFAAATGLQPGSTPAVSSDLAFPPVQPLYSQPPPHLGPLLMTYHGIDAAAPHLWPPLPVHYEGLPPDLLNPQLATDPAWQPPYPAPPYPAMGTDDPDGAQQAPADAAQQGASAPPPPNEAPAIAVLPANASAPPPPNEAPKLPQAVHACDGGLGPPPQEPPTLPPAVEPTLPPAATLPPAGEPTLPPAGEPTLPPAVPPPLEPTLPPTVGPGLPPEEGITPPPPMSSPKLPKDVALSLHEGGPPPAPPPSLVPP